MYKVHESPEKLHDTKETEVQGPEGQTIGVKRKSLTTNMNPQEKPKARRQTQVGETVDKRQEFSPQDKSQLMKSSDNEDSWKILRGRV